MELDPPATPVPSAPFGLGRWHVDPALDELALDGQRHKIEPRCMRLLQALAREPGRVWSADALLDAVWPALVVTPASLYQAIAALRHVLAQDTQTGAFIATVPRKGYRLVAPVQAMAAATAPVLAQPPAPRDLGPRSLAVLPFRVRDLPASLGFLRESLLGDLVAALSRQPQLAVVARGTMLTYADRAVDYAQLALQLGVRFVVDGAIAPAGDGLRILAELVDAASGQQIWSETLVLERDGWPALGEVVVGRLARVLNLELTAGAVRRPLRSGGSGTDALGTALQAWVELYCRPQTRDTNDRAWHWARTALQADDTLAIAWNALAYCEWRAAQYAWHRRPRDELLAEALRHAARAVELDPRDADAPYTMALCAFSLADLARTQAALRDCLALSPSHAPAHGLLGLLRAAQGHPQDTAAHCARAFALSPREPLRVIWHWAEAWAALLMDAPEVALVHAQRGIQANADFPSCHLAAAVAAHRLGDGAQARRSLRALQASGAFTSVAAIAGHLPWILCTAAGARLLDALREAGLPPGS